MYLDLVFFINFFFDFLILYATKLVLKETTSIKRIVLGSFFGSLTIFLLFLSLSNFILFICKVIISILIVLITFGKNNFFSDFLYFYLISIILGGFLYLLDINFNNLFNFLLSNINYFSPKNFIASIIFFAPIISKLNFSFNSFLLLSGIIQVL